MMFATLARKEQVPHAILLASAIKKHHPEAQIALCLVECHLQSWHLAQFDEVLLVSGQGYPEDDSANAGPTKAYFIKHLLNRYLDDIVYLDPEIMVLGPFQEVFALLDHHPIITAPFNLEPCPKEHDSWEIERLQNGFIHSGFLALKNSDRSRQFVHWWSSRVNRSTFGPARSGEADHLWLSLAVVPFGIHLLREPGYHYACWNWHEQARSITHHDMNSTYLLNRKPLRSFITAGAREMLQHSPVPLSARTRETAEQLLDRRQEELDQVRQTLL